jgi:hypothetical protein
VMLGLLGSFLGMVDTLQGAVMALEGTSELEAVRAGLSAPIKGLGVDFGTFVAGVAASAMLGLSSTLSKRERLMTTGVLDSNIATSFRHYSLVYNRQETYQALQAQATALTDVANKLSSLIEKIELKSESLSDKICSQQDTFHSNVQTMVSDLTTSVDQSLKVSLAESGQLAGDSMKPIIEGIVADIKSTTQGSHQQLTDSMQNQLTHLSQSWSEQQSISDKERLATWSTNFETLQQQAASQLTETNKTS